MKISLIAINSKYIHSNLAVYSLKKYAEVFSKNEANVLELYEYTINQQPENVLQSILESESDVLCFSCYIWNISYVERLISDISKIKKCDIWIGGPEVSYNAKYYLEKYNIIKGVMRGEGESLFAKLNDYYAGIGQLEEIDGITYKNDLKEIILNKDAEVLDFSSIPFPYEDLAKFENRIIYYETSRGCPFGCAYCLSSIDKKLRFRKMEQVKYELNFLVQNNVPQVKFVDRTFNADHKRSVELLQYIQKIDKGITNFHFEIAGDILTEDEIQILESLRPGLVQLEIGVQSTNQETLNAISRKTDMTKLKENIARLLKSNNMHIHLDLIAGLPYEDMKSFMNSFNEVYFMGGHELQLGFLKMLKGTSLTDKGDEYGIKNSEYPPYEVLKTNYISYEDISKLKYVEEVLEIYHNSMQFINSEKFIIDKIGTPFDFYEAVSQYYKINNYSFVQSSRSKKYEILLEFWCERNPEDRRELRMKLTLDYYLRENPKKRPDFCEMQDNDYIKNIYLNEKFKEKYLSKYNNLDMAKIRRITHIEVMDDNKKMIAFFDYSIINPVTNCADVYFIYTDELNGV